MNRFVDLSGIRRRLCDLYIHTGRLTIDPELLIRMPLTGYLHDIRSGRQLREEVDLKLAYRWFL